MSPSIFRRFMALFVFLGLAIAAGAFFIHAAAVGAAGPRLSDVLSRQAAVDPPQLWRAAVLDPGGGVRGSVEVCADQTVRSGFTHPLPQINGEMCLQMGKAVDRPGLYATRCIAHGQRFSVNTGWTGDLTRDFTVTFATRPLQMEDPGAVQVTRYRRLGACPAGWRIGQSVKG